eukprot:CAMPEP_0198661142 /NCGR_PEP_ID=MMETSP1467-20131203/40167_1 /TAXON_ID=1462469 /ORGANISM="unid. sp., Strain CCMP2135" /LENGTH=430 /DNA_ID=CAMNT_0044397569 /DNA_START=148 /DNA_END=1440 /DNA_ORIENTATION=-
MVFSLLLVATAVSAKELEALSFSSPFSTLNSQGDRQVSKNWRPSGSTSVQNYFVRLTPDRQSKKGALWATKALGTSEVSVAMKFRISGQGKKYFGDGMALWLTDARNYRAGEFHGATEKFKGIAVILDTFKNVELLSYHKDVTVVFNEGQLDQETMLTQSVGCNGDVRYHEDRGDFSVNSASRVKFVIEPLATATAEGSTLSLSVYLDASNSGEYKECVAATPLPSLLDAQWLSRAFLGISASTGQLADNHDVLGLGVYSDKEVHDMKEIESLEESHFEVGAGFSEDRFVRIEQQINTLLAKFDYLEHHVEHELVAVDDHVRTTVEKLAKQETAAEKRIDVLESQVLSQVENSLADRIANLESAMRDAVQKRMKNVEQNTVNTITATVSDKLKAVGSGWGKPFLFLAVFQFVAFGFIYRQYLKFKKDHLL